MKFLIIMAFIGLNAQALNFHKDFTDKVFEPVVPPSKYNSWKFEQENKPLYHRDGDFCERKSVGEFQTSEEWQDYPFVLAGKLLLQLITLGQYEPYPLPANKEVTIESQNYKKVYKIFKVTGSDAEDTNEVWDCR